MTEQTILILVAAVVVVALLLLFLARGRKQAVRLSDAAPPPRAVTPRAEPALDDPLLRDGGDLTAGAEPAPPAPALAAEGDRLTVIKGLGPKAAARLQELGVTRYDQIASWSAAEIEAIDAQMGPFRGRITRDRWVDQARLLADGDTAGFEAAFGRIGGTT